MDLIQTTATTKIQKMEKRLRCLPGGTSASKTFSIILSLIRMSLMDEKPTLTSVVSESFPHLKRGAMRDFISIMTPQFPQGLGIFKEGRWNKTDSIYSFETGSQIEFFSVDQADKVRGARRDRLFINEANNIDFESFEQLEVRTKEFIFLDWNPSSEFWYYTELKGKRNDVEELTLTYRDNEALSKEIIASIEQRKNRPGWWKVYGQGILAEIEGKIYNGWQVIDEIPHEARLERYGIDFGYTNDPTAIVAIYYYNGGYILDEICYQKEMTNKDIADFLKNQEKAMAVADSAEPKSIDDIKGYGISIVGANKGKDSVRHGIGVIQSQRISITKRSSEGLKEYRNYLWEVDKSGRVVSPNTPDPSCRDHFLDATRYGLSSVSNIIQRKEFLESLPVFTRRKLKNPAR